MPAYRVIAPVLAVERSDGRRVVIEIPAGEVLAIPGDVPVNGIIEITYKDGSVDIFSQDLHRRAEPIECASKVKCAE